MRALAVAVTTLAGAADAVEVVPVCDDAHPPTSRAEASSAGTKRGMGGVLKVEVYCPLLNDSCIFCNA